MLLKTVAEASLRIVVDIVCRHDILFGRCKFILTTSFVMPAPSLNPTTIAQLLNRFEDSVSTNVINVVILTIISHCSFEK